MPKSTRNKTSGLLRIVQERELLKKEIDDEEKRKRPIPDLPKDCVSCILLRLPVNDLQRSSCVCKPWNNMINTSMFIEYHLCRSEYVTIFLSSHKDEDQNNLYPPSVRKENATTFSVEKDLLKSVPVFCQPSVNERSKSYIHFLEIHDGRSNMREYNISCLGKIFASCNGLILLENKLKEGGLIVLNPVTRKLNALPVGTICPRHAESNGFVLDPSSNEYKVIHMFRDESGYISCEILSLRDRKWKEVNGPSLGLITWFGYKPVSAVGALNWLPSIDHNDYVVSMEIENAKFKTLSLPKSGRIHDGIVEMEGFLCFVAHEPMNRIVIWVLKSLSEVNWMKQQSIEVGCIMDMVPVSGSRFGNHMIFRRDEDGSLYVYDFNLKVMSFVEMENGVIPLSGSYVSHVNSLVSWPFERSGK
ncbi:hypothetical protein Nepgr_023622 [Nepenthes gracilis]|uniref:F-box domain-containing protein n=1 Tax=Nepenthes gracilis TaxID=150966 RepID=A0AAD3XZA1_NEPGR|nr:hypothetical protein Nepgr_023622 [Nepenthes gracilis]